MYNDYLSAGVFLIRDEKKSDLFHSGSSWIYNYYAELSEKYPKQCPECNVKADEVMRLIDQEYRADQKTQYQKIIKKADDCFQQQDFLKAKEYYQRAVTFRPSDPYPKQKLKEIDEICSKQPETK